MKRTLTILFIAVMTAASVLWLTHGGHAAESDEKEAAKPAAGDEKNKTTISHDANGNTVVRMSPDVQKDSGIAASTPAAAQWSAEMKGYGRVLDPTPLIALQNELATDQAAWTGSSNELFRLQTLSEQGNASARSLQAAEAAAAQNRLAVQSAEDRLALTWGVALSGRADLPALAKSLATRDAALVRVDLPAGTVPPQTPDGARLVALSGASTDADYLEPAPNTDPQIQGIGLLFLSRTNSQLFAPGQAVTGYLKIPGAPLSGVILPREAVVRTEGKGWVYAASETGDSFTRLEIPLDRPAEGGWFVTNAVTARTKVVTTGAQMLLSEEMKAAIQPD